MRYQFSALVVIDDIRAMRLERERRSEDSGDFSHGLNPFRHSSDCVVLVANVESPSGLTPEQQQAFADALDTTLRQLRLNIASAFARPRLSRTHAISDVYQRFQHLDAELRSGAQATDPIYQACAAMWEAIASDRTEAS